VEEGRYPFLLKAEKGLFSKILFNAEQSNNILSALSH
jgi:hypothetical protein